MEQKKQTDPHVEAFDGFTSGLQQPSWLQPLRKAGLASFADQGFPTLQDEDWRFTNVAPIARLPFQPSADGSTSESISAAVERAPFGAIAGHRLVFINGHFARSLSSIGSLPAGVVVQNLSDALANGHGGLEKHLTQYARTAGNAFAALNQAYFADGVFIHVPAGMEVPEPVHLIFVSSAKQQGTTIQPRNLILADANSRLVVTENYVHTSTAPYLTNAVTELIAGDGAHVELIKVQDEAADSFHVATIHGQFGRASRVNVHSFSLGARLARNNIRTKLAGEGLECVLNGLYLTRGEQLADHHMIVEHAEPHCASHEYFNGILDDKSKGVFHGRILVQQLAQKTDAKQTNKNLLLSDDATADTKPQLEIYADDVKCTHGATIGQLNDESIFYLRSRGLSQDTARRMLIHAFAGEIIERIRCESVRDELDRIVWDRLEANPHLR
ncbi:MAG TPA: Fe-S cluster assembly protein SufD [Verrucomicrobiae bacterium]|nr:Fe-S cluster assembly protein SufD [Verrucomicrobiae bacterium]